MDSDRGEEVGIDDAINSTKTTSLHQSDECLGRRCGDELITFSKLCALNWETLRTGKCALDESGTSKKKIFLYVPSNVPVAGLRPAPGPSSYLNNLIFI